MAESHSQWKGAAGSCWQPPLTEAGRREAVHHFGDGDLGGAPAASVATGERGNFCGREHGTRVMKDKAEFSKSGDFPVLIPTMR